MIFLSTSICSSHNEYGVHYFPFSSVVLVLGKVEGQRSNVRMSPSTCARTAVPESTVTGWDAERDVSYEIDIKFRVSYERNCATVNSFVVDLA